MRLHDGEPEAGPWRVAPLDELAAVLLAAVGDRAPGTTGAPGAPGVAGAPGAAGPAVVAVDGRGSSGKSTLAGRLAAVLPRAAVVHTDDLAWWHSPFGWTDLLVRGVLEPLRRGAAVRFRPPAWESRGRPGAVEVPAGCAVVLVEGVGAGRREHAAHVDAVLYVQSDLDERERRDAVRVAAGEISPAAYASWMAEEDVLVLEQRAWERACVVACGTPELPYDPQTQVLLAPPPGRAAPG